MTQTAPAQAPNYPLFYKQPRPLDKTKDAKLKISRTNDFNFAAKTNAIPLVGEEFSIAAAQYPIVFTAGQKPIAAAVVGLNAEDNLCIDAKGQWLTGQYIPAYTRRYPFIYMEFQAEQRLLLCVDEASPLLSEKGELPLFDGDNAAPITEQALRFCTEYRQQTLLTEQFTAALAEHNLLVENNANVKLASGKEFTLRGFQVIDLQKFAALSDKAFLEFRHNGWLPLVYAHFMSMQQWDRLMNLASAKEEALAAAPLPAAAKKKAK